MSDELVQQVAEAIHRVDCTSRTRAECIGPADYDYEYARVVISLVARAQRDADVAIVLACADRTERGNAARVEARACGHCLTNAPLVTVFDRIPAAEARRG